MRLFIDIAHGHLFKVISLAWLFVLVSPVISKIEDGKSTSHRESTTLDSQHHISYEEKNQLRKEAKEMFYHGYNSYMDLAFPADELMPLSCKGRWRGVEKSRGDIDDALGNFSLTLVDTLDTLVIMGDLNEFERALRLVIEHVSFDHNVIVSLFETNIRMIGGLISAHILAEYVKQSYGAVKWYKGELLGMAQDLGTRLLPAFNTTTGIPYPKVNLKYGMKSPELLNSRDTCTACAGTIVLEFASLSRLTGDPIFEEKARRAMDYLWTQRHRGSDLMGTVLNVHNGDWIRRDSGVGAGIDSYYEYLLKGYILFGDMGYLERFNKHYTSVMKYISQGPMLVDVHMHRPLTTSRNFMDSLLAFWPGLQVLSGDIKPAIETHEMLYQVIQRHNFLPEAFTTDFQIHWGQHPLRPEFVESTYLLYQATNDPYYLHVGKEILKSLQKHVWVPCGFAAVKDVRTGELEDRMDSFVLTETFKYLFLLFADKRDLLVDLDEFIFTTEAHLLPLSLARLSNLTAVPLHDNVGVRPNEKYEDRFLTCPNIHSLLSGKSRFSENVRKPLKNFVNNICPSRKIFHRKLRASDFQSNNADHLALLKSMGVTVMSLPDGRVQLLHTSSDANSPEDAEEGLLFMQEMIELSKHQQDLPDNPVRAVSFFVPIDFNDEDNRVAASNHRSTSVVSLRAGHAQFGLQLEKDMRVSGRVVKAVPFDACGEIENGAMFKGKIILMERGKCMFIDKARLVESLGAVGGVVVDNIFNSSVATSPIFAMSGDGTDNVSIPLLFLYRNDAEQLMQAMVHNPDIVVTLSDYSSPTKRNLSSNDEEGKKGKSKDDEYLSDFLQSIASHGEDMADLVEEFNFVSVAEPDHTEAENTYRSSQEELKARARVLGAKSPEDWFMAIKDLISLRLKQNMENRNFQLVLTDLGLEVLSLLKRAFSLPNFARSTFRNHFSQLLITLKIAYLSKEKLVQSELGLVFKKIQMILFKATAQDEDVFSKDDEFVSLLVKRKLDSLISNLRKQKVTLLNQNTAAVGVQVDFAGKEADDLFTGGTNHDRNEEE